MEEGKSQFKNQAKQDLVTGDWSQLNLKPQILENVLAQNFTYPSHIQFQAIPLIQEGKDFIIQSKNGSGKTAAFVLGALQKLDPALQTIQCICFAPTRELAFQIYSVFETFSKNTGFIVKFIKREDKSCDLGHIIVSTPGIFDKLIKKKVLSIQTVQMMIIDEADFIFETDALKEIAKSLIAQVPTCQKLLFSATYSSQIRKYVKQCLQGAQEIYKNNEELTLVGVDQSYIKVDPEQKDELIAEIYKELLITQTIIFVKNKISCQRLKEVLKERGFTIDAIDGSTSVEERDKIFKDFFEGRIKILITTNLLARGIDVSLVSLVINYDLPQDPYTKGLVDLAAYLHRVGRTGRFGKYGVALSLASRQFDLVMIEQIEANYKVKISECNLQQLAVKVQEAVQLNEELREVSNY